MLSCPRARASVRGYVIMAPQVVELLVTGPTGTLVHTTLTVSAVVKNLNCSNTM